MSEFEALKAKCLQCRNCSLAVGRQQVVFGEGNPDADLLLVGEAPGEREDVEGRPFVGRSGRLLDDMLATIGLSRADLFITNINKCRPPKNRNPLSVEQNACIDWLRLQVKVIQPKLIVCLGRVAAQKLIKPDLQITKEHGQWFDKNGYLLMATYHPAALLRNPNNRPDAFEDLQALRRKLNEVQAT